MRIIIFILLFPSICFSADKWTKTDIALETTFQIVNFVDYRQTHYIGDNKGYEERNPFIGKHPRDRDINNAFLVIGLSHAFITHNLPKKQRKYWHYSMILYKFLVINHNKQAGVHFSF